MNLHRLSLPTILSAILALTACQPLMPLSGGTVPPVNGTVPPVNGTIPPITTTAPAGDVNAGANDNGAWVTMLPGETLAVTLEANSATGYSWQVGDIDPVILVQQGESVYSEPRPEDAQSMPGKGGSETFLFVAEDTGETTVELVYKRPWETDVTPTPEQIYRLNIVVEEEMSEEASQALASVLTGTVTYRQRIALPPGSVIEVKLQEVSRADAPAQVIASQTITTSGENVPIPFELAYDPAQIDPRFTYALSVRITINGQLRWVNSEQYAVLTGGNPTDNVEVVVSPAG